MGIWACYYLNFTENPLAWYSKKPHLINDDYEISQLRTQSEVAGIRIKTRKILERICQNNVVDLHFSLNSLDINRRSPRFRRAALAFGVRPRLIRRAASFPAQSNRRLRVRSLCALRLCGLIPSAPGLAPEANRSAAYLHSI